MMFTEKLYQLRREKGLSQEQLAEKLDVSRQAVSKWETGETQPDMSKLLSLCEAFEISMDELCGNETKNAGKPEASLSGRKKFSRLCIIFLAAGLLIGFTGGYFGQAVFKDKAEQTAPQGTLSQVSSQDATDNDHIFDNLNITSFSFYPPFAEDTSKTLRIIFSPSISSDALKYEVIKTDNDGNTTRYSAEYSGGLCQFTMDWDYHTWFTLSAAISDGRNIYTAGLIKIYNRSLDDFDYEELWNKSE